MKARIKLPASARRGETIEVHAMVLHPHESGFRLDNVGKLIPRNIVTRFTCHYAGREVFRADLYPAIATNPYFSFFVVASDSGQLIFTWEDDRGQIIRESARLDVADA